MRYLVKAKVKPGREKSLLQAVADGTLGRVRLRATNMLGHATGARGR